MSIKKDLQKANKCHEQSKIKIEELSMKSKKKAFCISTKTDTEQFNPVKLQPQSKVSIDITNPSPTIFINKPSKETTTFDCSATLETNLNNNIDPSNF